MPELPRDRETWIDEILLACQARLADRMPLEPESVRVVLEGQERNEPPPGDHYAEVFPGNQTPIVGMVTGAGLVAPGAEGVLSVAFYTRLAVDEADSHEKLLVNPHHGMLPRWRKGVAALHLFDPLDDDGRPLLMEPMRLLQFGFRPPKAALGWASVTGTWEIKYVLNLA